jgi:dTDP-4-amino-4,6-dideoxygalactose transaminase
MNFTDLQACLGRVQLRRQPEFHATRLAIAREYASRLREARPALQFQAEVLNERHARHLMLVMLPIEQMRLSRHDVVLALRERKIGASIHYRPLHTFEFYRARYRVSLPNTEWAAERVFTLPISANMTPEDARQVSGYLIDILS